MKKVLPLALIAGVTVLGLTGCYAEPEYVVGSNKVEHINDLTINGYSDQDYSFISGMTPHHEQAIVMSRLALTNSSNPEIKTIAQNIIDAQTLEIATLKTWADTAESKTADHNGHMGMNHSMDGMLSDAEMTALSKTSGTEFDKLYLMGMINHHEGAIVMANNVISTQNEDVKAFAENVIKVQQSEIDKMKSMLAAL